MLGQDVVRAARFTNHEVAALDRDALDVSDERAVRRAWSASARPRWSTAPRTRRSTRPRTTPTRPCA